MEYHVTEVLKEVDADYGKKRIAFKTEETGSKTLSCFTPYPDTVRPGKVIYGEVAERTVEGRVYYNFTFTKKDAAPTKESGGPQPSNAEIKNLINLKVMPEFQILRDKMNELLAAFDRILHRLGSE